MLVDETKVFLMKVLTERVLPVNGLGEMVGRLVCTDKKRPQANGVNRPKVLSGASQACTV